MLKNLIYFSIVAVIAWSCGSSFNSTELNQTERLQYALGLYQDEDYLDAANEFEAILLQFPGSSVVDDAQYYLAMCRYQREEFIIAAYEFSKLIKNMPASEFVPQAQFMLAESYYGLSPDYNLDQSYTKKAIEEYQAFIDFFPLNEKVNEAEQKINELNQKLAHKDYDIAVIYEKLDYHTAALKYFDVVIETYHDTRYAPMASYKKIHLLIEREREDEALAEAKRFLSTYPDDENYNEVEEIKNSLEGSSSISSN